MARCVRGPDTRALAVLDRHHITTWYPKIVELRPVPQRRLSHLQRSNGVNIQKPVQTPMFPGYVLLQGPVPLTAYIQAGLGGFACEGDRMVVIRGSEIARIRKQENGGMIDGKTSLRVIFNIGDEVTVSSGPFASYPGIVEKGLDVAIADLDPTTRIKVAINIFGRMTPIAVEVYQVARRA